MPASVIKPRDRRNRNHSVFLELTYRQEVVCYICGKWGIGNLGHIIKENYRVIGNTCYILPSSHKKCKEIFDLCPPIS